MAGPFSALNAVRRLLLCLPWMLASAVGACSAVSAAASRAAVTTAADQAHGIFGGVILSVRFFSATSGLAVTSDGVLVTDGSLDRWKAVAGWERAGYIAYYAGGDEKTVYLVSSSCKDVVVGDASGEKKPPPESNTLLLSRVGKRGKIVWVRHDYTWTLVRWTAGAGWQDVRTLPCSASDPRLPGRCAFVSAETGAFVQAEPRRPSSPYERKSRLFVTRNGGKTWTGTEVYGKPPGIQNVVWIDAAHLVVSEPRGTVLGLALAADGHVGEKWRTDLGEDIPIYFGDPLWFGNPLKLSPDAKTLWVYTDFVRAGRGARLHALSPADGGELRTDWPLTELRAMRDAAGRAAPPGRQGGESLHGFAPANNRLYVWGLFLDGGGNFTASYDLATKKVAGTVTIVADHVQAVSPRPDGSAFLVTKSWGQLLPWDGRDLKIRGDARDFPGPAVDRKLLDEAAQRRPGTPDRPSEREWREHEQASKQVRETLGFQRYLEIVQERASGDFDNLREFYLWQTRRFREAVAAAPSAKGATKPAR